MEETMGMRVRKLRLDAGMTQQELALKMGRTSRSYVNKLELGHNDFSHTEAAMLSEIFSVSPAYLVLGLTDDEPAQKSSTYTSETDKELLSHFHKLTDYGKQTAIKRVKEMTELPQYTVEESEKKA